MAATENQKEVLLLSDESDDLFIKKYIIPELEEANLNFYLPETDIQLGVSTHVTTMPALIEKSKKVLFILSKYSKKRFKCTYEIFLALEKSISTNKMCVTIALLDELDRHDIPKIPMLEHSMIARLTNNDLPFTIKKVTEIIKGECVDLEKKMPVGNLATGLAWSHFLGYLQIILTDFADNVINSEWFSTERMSTRFFMLLPRSGKCPVFQDEDPRIKRVGNLKIEKRIAGAGRIYTPNVYSVSDNQTEYYCCAEVPSAFGCIGKIFFEKLGRLTPQQRNLEVERFYHVLDQILNHEHNKRCHMLYELIVYNDEDKSEEGLPSTHMLRHIHKKTEVPGMQHSQKQYKSDVCILHCLEDKQQAYYIQSRLREKPERPNIILACPESESIPELEEKVKNSKWIVLILSKNHKTIEFWLAELLSSAVDDKDNESQDICVLPLLYKIEPEKIPTFIRWLTYIEAKEDEDYVSRVFEVIKGQRVALRTQSPVGNVHQGLVWGFVVNYLRHVLPEITERILQRLKALGVDVKDPRVHYHSGLLEIVPLSGEVPAKLEDSTNKCTIQSKGRIDATKEQQETKVVRVFSCNFYELTKNGHSYYFAGEFATPIRTLQGMANSIICGLTLEKMRNEAKLFSEKLEGIMKKEKEGHKCAILRLNDNADLSDLIIKEISEHEEWRRTH